MPMCPGAKALAHEYFDIWAHKHFLHTGFLAYSDYVLGVSLWRFCVIFDVFWWFFVIFFLWIFEFSLKTKKVRDVRMIILAAVSRRDLCYVSENKGFRFWNQGVFVQLKCCLGGPGYRSRGNQPPITGEPAARPRPTDSFKTESKNPKGKPGWGKEERPMSIVVMFKNMWKSWVSLVFFHRY